jgi:hypothetical protein
MSSAATPALAAFAFFGVRRLEYDSWGNDAASEAVIRTRHMGVGTAVPAGRG